MNSNSGVRIKAENLSLSYRLTEKSLKAALNKIVLRKSLEKKIDVIKNINFEIRSGELVCVGGANGTGKSSLLYAICGKMAPETGKIDVIGDVIAFFGFHGGISPFDTGEQILRFLQVFHGGIASEIDAQLERISRWSGLPLDLIKYQPFYTYSSGMRSRLLASFALSQISEINVFDETLAAGDVRFVDLVAKKIKNRLTDGCSYIVASHSRTFWEKTKEIGGRFLILGNEKIAYDGKDLDLAWQAYLDSVKYKAEFNASF